MGFRNVTDDFFRHWRAYALAASASMGSLFYGWDTGVIGGVLALQAFQQYFGVDKLSPSQRANLAGNVVSVLQGGCFFGSLSTAYLSSRFGRKPMLLVAGIIYLIGSLIQGIVGIGSSHSTALKVLYLARFVGGIGVGMVSALVPSYISECTPKSIRGRCTGMIQFSNNFGVMLSFWVNYSSNADIPYGELQWRAPFIVQMIPGILFVLLMAFQPESPIFLVGRGKFDRAARSLAFVMGTTPHDEQVIVRLEEIKADFKGKKKASLRKQLARMGESRIIALRCFIPALVMLLQQATGTNAVNYFSPQIFASLGIKGTSSALFATGIYGLVKVIFVAIVLAVAVEGMGRKRCLIYGGLGQAVTMLWIGGYAAIHSDSSMVPASYVSIIALYLFAAFHCLGWGPIPWVVAAEVAPNQVRTPTMAIAIGTNWLFAFIISRLTPIMLEKIKYGTFLLFGVSCIIMVLWTYVCLPETKGVALEDIKYLFERDVILRSLQDAPGGRLFVGTRRATSINELRQAVTEGVNESDKVAREGKDGVVEEIHEYHLPEL